MIRNRSIAVRLPYALRYLDLFCAPSRAEHRITCDCVVVVLLLALLFRLLHMRTALEKNSVSKQLAIYLGVMAGNCQSTLRARGIVGQQRSIEKGVALNREGRITASNIEKNVRDGEAASEKNFGLADEVKSARNIEHEGCIGRAI